MLSGSCVLLARVCCAEESYGLTENSGGSSGIGFEPDQVPKWTMLVGLLVRAIASLVFFFDKLLLQVDGQQRAKEKKRKEEDKFEEVDHACVAWNF